MDLSEYLLNDVFEATTPPDETKAAARSRSDAIAEMMRAYDPRTGMEAMMACQCVMLQFMLKGAMRDASIATGRPEDLAKARAGAITASRALHQWVTKFENTRKRNETLAAEAAKAQDAMPPEQNPTTDAPVTPPPQPIQTPPPNGRGAAETTDRLLATAAAIRAVAQKQDPRASQARASPTQQT